MYYNGPQVSFFQYNDVFLYLRIAFTLRKKNEDPDEIQQYLTFHLGPHCVPNYSFMGFQYTKTELSLNADLQS